MEKFKTKKGNQKVPRKVVGKVSKDQPHKFNRKLLNILRENKALRSSIPKEKYVPSKNRFKGTVIAETANISDSQSIKKMSWKKLKSVPTQTYISNDSSLSEDDNQHKYTQTYTDTDSSSVDSIHCRKSTQANIQLDELEEKNDEIVEARTDSIGEEQSNVAVASWMSNIKEENDAMKSRKRKMKLQEKFNTPMVVDAHMSVKSCAPPRILQSFDSDIDAAHSFDSDIDAAMSEFYESLKETSAEVHVASDESDVTTVIEEENVDVDKSTDSSKECEEPSVLFHLVNKNQVLVFMKHPFSLFFKGVLNITVLRGRIEVLGFVMDSCSKTQRTVFSPKGSSMVGIDACVADPPCSEDYEQLEKSFEDLDIDLTISKALIAGIERCGCVILLEAPTQSPFENYLKTLTSEMQLFSFSRPLKSQEKTSSHRRSEVALNCVFEFANRKSYKQFMKTDEWEETSDTIIRSNKEDAGACTVICGGKGVGKSTFLRFLVNRHLTMFREVLVLDFDPGQAEFTVPGCVSAVVVMQPLLGPNFTHLKKASCMVYVGDVNIAQCPKQYLDSAQHIINFCRSRTDFQKMPWIINTMGFNKGIGVDLTVSLLRMLNPRFVVEIKSNDLKSNFPAQLSAGYVWQYRSSFSHIPANFIPYSLFNIVSASEGASMTAGLQYSFELKPAHLREAMVISYFSEFLLPPTYSLTEIVPYKIILSKLILSVCHTSVPNSQILSAMNGNLVALCTYKGNDILIPEDKELPRILRTRTVCPCLGFGVVRGIDLVEKTLYLVTPLPVKDLSDVNCLMLGAVMLPDYVYTQFKAGKGLVPYVATGPGQATSKPKIRPYFILKNKEI